MALKQAWYGDPLFKINISMHLVKMHFFVKKNKNYTICHMVSCLPSIKILSLHVYCYSTRNAYLMQSLLTNQFRLLIGGKLHFL